MAVSLLTETAHGDIRHMRIITGAGPLDAPVKLKPATQNRRSRNGLSVGFDGLPYPEYDQAGRLVFVLPGGVEIAA